MGRSEAGRREESGRKAQLVHEVPRERKKVPREGLAEAGKNSDMAEDGNELHQEHLHEESNPVGVEPSLELGWEVDGNPALVGARSGERMVDDTLDIVDRLRVPDMMAVLDRRMGREGDALLALEAEDSRD